MRQHICFSHFIGRRLTQASFYFKVQGKFFFFFNNRPQILRLIVEVHFSQGMLILAMKKSN